jgi:hypothetical protein
MIWFVVAAWLLFGGTGYVELILVMISLLVFMAIAIPSALWRANVAAQRSNASPNGTEEASEAFGTWLRGQFATWTNQEKGSTAAVEILSPIAAVAFDYHGFGHRVRTDPCGGNVVPRHSDYDWLILSQSRMGKSSGGTRIWMLLATLLHDMIVRHGISVRGLHSKRSAGDARVRDISPLLKAAALPSASVAIVVREPQFLAPDILTRSAKVCTEGRSARNGNRRHPETDATQTEEAWFRTLRASAPLVPGHRFQPIPA